MAEALNGTFKAELIKLHGPWRTLSIPPLDGHFV
jgi:hypothetical protein